MHLPLLYINLSLGLIFDSLVIFTMHVTSDATETLSLQEVCLPLIRMFKDTTTLKTAVKLVNAIVV